MQNVTKQLIDDFHLSVAYLVYKIECSDQTVKNWYGGLNAPRPIYQKRLERLLAQKQKKASESKSSV
jgi:hypothetical protein